MAKKKTINKKKAVASKSKKTTAKKTATKKKAPAKKAPVKKKPAAKKKTPAKKAPVKKKSVAKKKTPAKKAPAKRKPVAKKKTLTKKKPLSKRATVKKPIVKKKVTTKAKLNIKKKKTVAKKAAGVKAKVARKKPVRITKKTQPKKVVKKKTVVKSISATKKAAAAKASKKAKKPIVNETPIKRGRPKKEVIQMPSPPAKTKKQVKEELKKITLKTNPDTKSGSIDPRKIRVKRPVLPVPKIIPIRKKPQPKVKTEAPKGTRYSDADLAEFKEVILKKLEEAKKELQEFQAQMSHVNEHGTDDTASTFKVMEDGSETLAKEEAGQLAGRQRKFISQLENALIRIENKTYGICRISGNLIRKERLLAVPHTTQSIEAKLNQK